MKQLVEYKKPLVNKNWKKLRSAAITTEKKNDIHDI